MEIEEHFTEIICLFFKRYPFRIYKPGEIILSPLNIAPTLFYIDKGVVSLYTIQLNGERFLINWASNTTIFPLFWGLADIQSPYYYEAKTVVSVFRVPKKEFLIFLHTHTDCLFFLMRKMLPETQLLSQRIELLIASSISDKLQFFLLNLSRSFGKKQKNGNIIIEFELGHTEIASWIHSTRESVTREITKLKKRRIIKMKDRQITICDINFLKEKFI